MKHVLFGAALAVSLLASRSLLAGNEEEFKACCPVSGKAASKDHAIDVKGKHLYFCCDNCCAAYQKDAAKFAAKVHQQFLATGQMVQVGCPLSGRPVNAETMVELGGAKFGFCCNNCKGKFEKASDDEKVAMVFGDISKGFTLQTTCPVSGKAIKLDTAVEHDGQKVYFCCKGCPEAFKKDPSKFMAKLPQFQK